jgi:hypothetical protein
MLPVEPEVALLDDVPDPGVAVRAFHGAVRVLDPQGLVTAVKENVVAACCEPFAIRVGVHWYVGEVHLHQLAG